MKLSLIIWLIITIVAFSGCRRGSQTQSNTSDSQTSQAEQLNHPAGGTTPVTEVKYFRGSIGSTLGLQMKLTREGDKVWGSYFYQKVGTKIDLKGTVDGSGYLTLEEFDPQGQQTGIFKGLWQQNDDGLISIAGNWTKPNGDKKTAFSLHQEPIEFSGGVEITSKTIKENNKKLKYEIDAEYPEVTGAPDGRYDKYNQEAKSLATREVANFRKDMAEWAADQAEIKTDQEPSNLGSSLDVGYTISLANDNLISTQFGIGTYFQGAAHPNSHTRVLNYDLKAGKPIKLADLFKPGSKYLQTISSYSIKELKKQSSKGGESMFDDEWVQKGAGPSADNYESWVMTKKGLGINFDAYQVAPYAAGPQYVLIPYSVLKDIAQPDGPLAPFLK